MIQHESSNSLYSWASPQVEHMKPVVNHSRSNATNYWRHLRLALEIHSVDSRQAPLTVTYRKGVASNISYNSMRAAITTKSSPQRYFSFLILRRSLRKRRTVDDGKIKKKEKNVPHVYERSQNNRVQRPSLMPAGKKNAKTAIERVGLVMSLGREYRESYHSQKWTRLSLITRKGGASIFAPVTPRKLIFRLLLWFKNCLALNTGKLRFWECPFRTDRVKACRDSFRADRRKLERKIVATKGTRWIGSPQDIPNENKDPNNRLNCKKKREEKWVPAESPCG